MATSFHFGASNPSTSACQLRMPLRHASWCGTRDGKELGLECGGHPWSRGRSTPEGQPKSIAGTR
eukprot:210359-Pyramimonas_sp.AAC.1